MAKTRRPRRGIHRIAGAASRDPADMAAELSPGARAMADAAYADVDPARLLDYHVHIAGTGADGSGCYVNPRMTSWLHPFERLKFEAYRSANCISEIDKAETQALCRLVELARHARGRFLVLAFDEHRGRDGAVVREKTEFHVPDDHVLKIAADHRGLLAACASVHPLRKDALEELGRVRAHGVRFVKWLPNAMGIDPSDPRCLPFYAALRGLDITLLSHGGCEKAVHAEEDQKLGNPLLLAAALDAGVRVVVAHCASLGDDEDLDDPARPRVPSWELFLRMMDVPRWKGLLFGDISAMTQSNRVPAPLRAVLGRPDLHARLVNGSDYPLPAINVVIRLSPLVQAELLDPADADALREIYSFNPLVFDYVLKRRLRMRTADGRELRFPPSVFEEHPALPVGDSPN